MRSTSGKADECMSHVAVFLLPLIQQGPKLSYVVIQAELGQCHFYLQANLVEGFSDCLELPDRVVGEAAALAAVVKLDAGLSLVLAEVGRGSKSGNQVDYWSLTDALKYETNVQFYSRIFLPLTVPLNTGVCTAVFLTTTF